MVIGCSQRVKSLTVQVTSSSVMTPRYPRGRGNAGKAVWKVGSNPVHLTR